MSTFISVHMYPNAHRDDARYSRHVAPAIPRANTIRSSRPSVLYEQVPQYQRPAKRARRPKHHLRGAPPLGRLLQLLVPTAHVLGRQLRVGHELVDVLCLDVEVGREGCLQLGNLEERLLGSAGVVSLGETEARVDSPNLVKAIFVVLEHVLVLLRKELELLGIELLLH
jgi:hypothetical protein